VNTKTIGDISEAAVIAALLKSGANVLMPFGDRNRYDVVIENDGKFERIQIKTGRIKHGVLRFYTVSVTRRKGKRFAMAYNGQIEKFGVYCPENDTVYMIPVEICAKSNTRFKIGSRKTHRGPACPNADDFALRCISSVQPEQPPV
jgi:PD-(D/E)XK endonuclease